MKFVFCAAFLLFLLPAQSQSTDLRLASDVWPPFTNVEGERAFASALVQEALKRSKVSSQTEIIPFGDVITGITHEQFDGSAALWHDPERDAYLLFSEPYLENRLVLVGPAGSKVNAESLDDLAKMRVGIVENYAYGRTVAQAKKVRIIKGSGDQENLDKLLRGELDYILVDELLIQHLLLTQKEEAEASLAIGTRPLITKTLHFAIRKELPRAAFYIQRFNENIKEMQRDGSYNQILQLNWIRADVDNDGHMELVLRGGNGAAAPPVNAYSLASMPVSNGGKKSNPQEQGDRFYVDGRMYDTWETVPDEYKRPDVTEEDLNKPGLSLLRIRF